MLLKRFPNWPKGYFNYAGFFKAQGKLPQSKTALLKVIELDPEHAGAYLALTEVSTASESKRLILAMIRLLEKLNSRPETQSLRRIQLHYGLGHALADQSNYAEAFEHWQHANRLQLRNCQFRVVQMKPVFDEIARVFSLLQYDPVTDRGTDKLTPIFIVGLPRSGSTLLEQMLSSHEEIETAGEVHYLADILVRKLSELTGENYPRGLQKISREQFLQLGDAYLEKLQGHHPQSKYIIDKLPANFQSIGLIRKALPHAIIVHLNRNPMAVGISVYRNYFLANEPYFCDLDEFAEYHQLYKELMSFWRGFDPASLYELTYESLIDSPKEQLSALLEYCGLTWQDQCLEFHKANNRVTTLSAGQVRQPLYRGSVDDWRHYSPFLQDFEAKINR